MAVGQRKRAPGSAREQSLRVPTLRTLSAWGALERHYELVKTLHLRQLFAEDPERGERLALEAAGVYLDFSKNRITDETVRLLIQLAQESGLRDRIEAMFRGDNINVTENRAVLHVALRAPRAASIMHDGKNVVPEVHAVLDKMADFALRVRSGSWQGHTGKRIRNVINIGIGGSDLGPVMAYEALLHGLLAFFSWRGAFTPEECVDRTLDRLAAREEERDRSLARLRALIAALPDPVLPLTEPVTVRVINDETGVCVGSVFSGALRNTDQKYVAKTQ